MYSIFGGIHRFCRVSCFYLSTVDYLLAGISFSGASIGYITVHVFCLSFSICLAVLDYFLSGISFSGTFIGSIDVVVYSCSHWTNYGLTFLLTEDTFVLPICLLWTIYFQTFVLLKHQFHCQQFMYKSMSHYNIVLKCLLWFAEVLHGTYRVYHVHCVRDYNIIADIHLPSILVSCLNTKCKICDKMSRKTTET